ncbi:pyridoxal phosphate-dependent decarboxylase family protein [Gluconobacter kanchanaburiensis]|uniref:Cytochrome d ubiquinol oxidase subunit I n=1 Tax=Gluconobacter kanchanaburiensis NBRC 103587 TaxID=1307948 RepID=A0A511B8K2_9PROT|nr:pyridoxal-dependent decarboxylase [Gluconobacter kanchanaburiensis]MBF0861178.1 cytochrome D ubiquinol oxidase subunit I [Gluconobacter kanchanaburiensis]GBR70820.1 aromatic-L-amino-acid decarboxylase [Gluconobacter kanchanaburiensis NBRC 103587]GEK96002.1 cytochrome d ubiquinol oxidase subunit I [Gluconobacter kanchanaburiensis NBRC 103587]
MAGLDPANWRDIREIGHRMLDEVFDRMEHVGEGPVWRPMPSAARQALKEGLPENGHSLDDLYERYRDLVVPYGVGNTHPGFMGWVHGAGTPVGMLAEMLAAGLNANCGGRDHAPIEVEREVIRWALQMTGMPQSGSGCLVTGSSMANFIGVIAASRAQDLAIRQDGLGNRGLVGYAATTAHGCLPRAFDLAGLGSSALRRVPVMSDHRMDVTALATMIEADRKAGLVPFMVAGTAGTVDCGAIDDLAAIGAVARAAGLWLHVDAAFGALACLSERFRPRLDGIENADSLAFDFHKWAQVPYDAGCVLVRDSAKHAAAFAQSLDYLVREDRGLAAGAPWFCDFGPDLSRGFRALKVWMTLGHYGARRMGEMVDACCDVAGDLARRIEKTDGLVLLAPVTLNIVCFGIEGLEDREVSELVQDLHESGIAAPSTTRINGRLAVRAAIVNHRTTTVHTNRMLDALIALRDDRLQAQTAR